MKCQVEGCLDHALHERTLVTIERRELDNPSGTTMTVITGWCDRHKFMEPHYKSLEEYFHNSV